MTLIVPPKITNEFDVQNFHRLLYENYLPYPHITSKIDEKSKSQTDIIIEDKNIGTIIHESKDLKNISNRPILIEVIMQILAEIKLLEIEGSLIPNLASLGSRIKDKEEKDIHLFTWFNTDLILSYLDYKEVNWEYSPSIFPFKNKILLNIMINDPTINPYIYNLSDTILFKDIIEDMKSSNKGVIRQHMATEQSSFKIFFEFVDTVLEKPKEYKNKPNEIVSIFLSIFNDPEEAYLHKNFKNILVTKVNPKVKVNRLKWQAFISRYGKRVSVEELNNINNISYLLIEETSRRLYGEIYTGDHISRASHEQNKITIGPGYLEIPTWDPASGLKGNIRFFDHNELYCSTFHEDDVKIAKIYNPGSIDFPYDYLCGNTHLLPYQLQIRLGLIKNEDDKELELATDFHITKNPPMKHSGSLHGKKNLDGKGLSSTPVSKKCQKLKLGGSGNPVKESSCLFLLEDMFILEKSGLDKAWISTYLNANILTKGAFFGVRKKLYDFGYTYKGGYAYNASEHTGNKPNWGMVYVIFRWERKNAMFDRPNFIDEYPVDIRTNINGELVVTGQKTLYGVENIITYWPKNKISKSFDIVVPSLSSALKPAGLKRSKTGSIGYLGRSRGDNWVIGSQVWVVSGSNITPHNFMESVAIFTAGKLVPFVTPIWLAESTELHKPNITHQEYIQWNNDGIIVSLFHSESEQSSMRNVEYHGMWDEENGPLTYHDLPNEWAWYSNSFIKNLANKYGNTKIHRDSIKFNQDRFVYKKLQNIQLSDDAQAVLNKANDLIEKSFYLWETMSGSYPEYHLDTWHPGWHQIRLILKEYMPEDLKEFERLYKNLLIRMSEGLYKFGFIK